MFVNLVSQEVYSKIYVDNYDSAVRKYLQDKYFTTIAIDSANTVSYALNQIQEIVNKYNNEIEYYNLIGGATNFTGLNLNLSYKEKIKENVECSNYTIDSGRVRETINEMLRN